MTVAVIGAGPAGMTAAYQLAKKGIGVEVFEAGKTVGGMARTIPLWGQRVDLGPHRFLSSDPRVNKVWLEVVGDAYSMVRRLTRIYYAKTFFDYPLRAANALKGLGWTEACLCIASYSRARLSPRSAEATFESWVVERFGRRLFTTFFKSYSEKLWGIPCTQLDSDFAAQRIRKFSLIAAIRAAIFSGQSRHRTLADEFAYPHAGTGSVYETMAARVVASGGRIHFEAPVLSVSVTQASRRTLLRLRDGTEAEFDHVVSTMPITLLVESMGAPAAILEHARALSFRNTILVYLRIEGGNPFPDQWIYVHSPDLKTGRITNFRNWVPAIVGGQPETIVCLEYWCDGPDPIWSFEDARLIALATAEMHATALIAPGSAKDGRVVRLPRCYPVYRIGYREHLAALQRYLSSQTGVTAIGRYGAFKYNNQDHSILMGLLAAENIADGAQHDLWAINTDDEYQESSRITATGLVKD